MRFIAYIADNWEQFTAKLANHGWHFNVRLGVATRDPIGRPRECAVFLDAHDQSFTREKSQGVVYYRHVVLASAPDRDVVERVLSQTREMRKVA